MTELGPEARALLEQTRDGDDPSERDRARMRQRLAVAMAAAATGAAVSAAAPAAATASAAATATATATKIGIGAQVAAGAQVVAAGGVTAKIGVAVTIAVISVAGSGVVLERELAPQANAREPAAEVAHRTRARVPTSASPAHASEALIAEALILEPLAAPAPEPPVIEPQSAAQPAAAITSSARTALQKRLPVLKARAQQPVAREPASIPVSLQTELQLLSLAQSALRDGEHDRVLALLAEHAARFPHGTLALERDAVRAITLCSSGRMASGRSAANMLAPRIAGSPLAARLERACEIVDVDMEALEGEP
jgi:hypothetical protein